jgi:hypothetical protein
MNVKLLTADVPTANGTIYPRAVLESAVAKAQDRIREKRMVGCYFDVRNDPNPDHSLNRGPSGQISIDMISHIVDSLRLEENGNMMAEITALKTPSGKKLRKNIEFHPQFIGKITNGQIVDATLLSIDAYRFK